MSPIISAKELFVLDLLIIEDKRLFMRKDIEDINALDALIRKGLIEETIDHAGLVVKPTIEGRWKYCSIVGLAEPAQKRPGYLNRIIKRIRIQTN